MHPPPRLRSLKLEMWEGLTPLEERLTTQAIHRFEHSEGHSKVLAQVEQLRASMTMAEA